MLVVIPISKTDEILCKNFSEIMNFFGPYFDHEALFVYKKSDMKLANQIKQNISYLFGNYSDYFIDENIINSWPIGPNSYWRKTILYLRSINNNKPWYWMELDVTPLKDEWLDELEKDYINAGLPFLGCVSESSYYYPSHLSGCAVYPPNISDYNNNWKWVHNSNTAFDIICSGEIMKYLVFDHYKMLNYFRTEKYKFDPKSNIFDFTKRYLFSDNGREKDIKKKELIIGHSLIHHGCKDGSLADEIIKYYDLYKQVQ
jgi:hypothetical protein